LGGYVWLKEFTLGLPNMGGGFNTSTTKDGGFDIAYSTMQ